MASDAKVRKELIEVALPLEAKIAASFSPKDSK
jgi:hypothetical protein